MTGLSCLRYTAVADTVRPEAAAAAFIAPGDNVGMSGFTGAGYPKAAQPLRQGSSVRPGGAPDWSTRARPARPHGQRGGTVS